MSRPLLFLKAFGVSLAVVSLVLVLGCTSILPGPGGTIPATSLDSTTVSPRQSEPAPHVPASATEQSAGGIQLEGNIYGISSNPHVGIDTITFTIGLALHAQEVDLTRMKIVFSTPGTEPVILTQGTRESTSRFTTTRGNYAMTSMSPGEEVEIAFRVMGVPAGSTVNIEIVPSSGASLSLSRRVPSMLYSTNILG